MFVGLRREVATLLRLAANPGLFTLASQKGYSQAVYAQATRLPIIALIEPHRTLPASLLSGSERNRISLALASHLQSIAQPKVAAKVSLIGTGNYDLMSAHGGQVMPGHSETEIIGFRVGATEFILPQRLRITLGK